MDAVKDRSAGWEHRHPEEPIDVEDYLSADELDIISKMAWWYPGIDREYRDILERFDRLAKAVRERG